MLVVAELGIAKGVLVDEAVLDGGEIGIDEEVVLLLLALLGTESQNSLLELVREVVVLVFVKAHPAIRTNEGGHGGCDGGHVARDRYVVHVSRSSQTSVRLRPVLKTRFSTRAGLARMISFSVALARRFRALRFFRRRMCRRYLAERFI